MNTVTARKESMYKEIRKHGEALNGIFNTGIEPIALCKKLRRIETVAHKLAEDYCNGVISTEQADKLEAAIVTKLGKVLFGNRIPDVPIFVNMDCRGYALKIDDEWLRDYEKGVSGSGVHKDWGGYGILAPDLSR